MRTFIPALLVTVVFVFTLPPLPLEPVRPEEPMQMSSPAPTAAVLVEPTEPPTEAVTESDPTYPLKDWERSIICRVMMSECPYEPADGQMAVAQVILDRLLSDEYPDKVYDVLTQPNQFAAPSDEDINTEVKAAVAAVFDRGERITYSKLLHFYAPRYGTSSWHEKQTFVTAIGSHKFYN